MPSTQPTRMHGSNCLNLNSTNTTLHQNAYLWLMRAVWSLGPHKRAELLERLGSITSMLSTRSTESLALFWQQSLLMVNGIVPMSSSKGRKFTVHEGSTWCSRSC